MSYNPLGTSRISLVKKCDIAGTEDTIAYSS
jgi:hypothetical protein